MKTKQIVAIALILLLVVSLLYTGCGPDPKPDAKPDTKTQSKPEVVAPDFSGDTAYAYVARQVKFGPRVPGTSTHAACGAWLEAMLKECGAAVTTQNAQLMSRTGSPIPIRNIIAQFQPEKKQRVLLCAHWDTRPIADKDPNPTMKNKPIDGANDGASGVGVLLEIARQLKAKPTNIGIDIVFFDAEDNGMPEGADDAEEMLNPGYGTSWCLGSQYWARNLHVPNYNPRFGILLDMVGAADAEFNKEATSMQYAEDVMNMVWEVANRSGYGSYFPDRRVMGVTDDHSFVNLAHVRCIDIIDTRPQPAAMGLGSYFFGPYHHTHNDNMDIIDANTLKAVGQTVMQVIYNQ